MKRNLMFAGVLLSSALLCAQELIYTPGPTMGITVSAKENNLWRTQIMDARRRIRPDELFETADDFFTIQYGKPFVFQSDLFREFGIKTSAPYRISDGALQFRTGKRGWSMLFGAGPGDEKTPAIRFGAGWGKDRSNAWRIELEIEQDVEKTDWMISRSSGDSKFYSNNQFFSVKGRGRQKFVQKMGWIGYPVPQIARGLKIECRTPGANIRIRSIRIVPFSGSLYWRREIQIPFRPIAAKLSWMHKTGNYDVFVNGVKIASGKHILRTGVETFDLLRHLKQGKNVIAFRDQFYGGLSQNSAIQLEGIIIGRNGETLRIPGDRQWRWSYQAPEGWEKPDFADKTWQTPVLRSAGISYLPNKTPISAGFAPDHMGLLEIRELGTPYPVFDYDKDIAWQVRVPAGLVRPTLRLEIREADTNALQETLTADSSRVNGDFREFTVRPKLRKTGAYRTFWTLGSNGKTLDTCRGEMIIAGPIEQKEFALKDFEQELEKRLQLVQKIDCTDPNPAPDTFLDHTGKYTKPTLNAGKVVTRNGMTYRETGSGLLDYFCYKLNLPSTGEAMIAELVVPDDADRYIYSAVLETVPAGMEHNTPPLGSKAWPNASGTVSTGDLYPLSNGKKKFRYVFFPGTKNTTLLVQNGRAGIPAAVCEINIYAVKGGLPALKIPKTDRTYGNHNERLIFNAWGSYGNALAYGTEAHLVHYYDGAWITAYRAIARKIQFLRFQGHNASVEGAFMYENGVFSSRHAQTVLNNDRFDYYHALLKLYKHNNIKTFVGFEYMRSSALDAMGAYDTSDAQVHSGKKRTVYMVDRFGRQVIGYMGMGLNCMNPVVWGTVTDLLKELYQRYDGIGNVEGLVTLNGSWWLPGFPSYSNMEAAEVGYDDDSVEQFEHDTGIRLNLPRTGAERFPARYQLLTGKYKQQWFAWRGKKIREKLLEMRKIVSSGRQKWQLFSWPAKASKERNAFNTAGIRPQVRDEYMERIQREAGFPQELYGKEKQDGITLVATANTARRLENNADLYLYGRNTNRGSMELYRKNDALALNCAGLNENIGTTAKAAKRWYWRANNVTIYDRKGVGDFAYADLIPLIRNHVPKHVFHTWNDINLPTAHGDQARRFLKAFYSIPSGESQKQNSVKGVDARFLGNHLILINATPFPLNGTLEYPGRFEDLVYDASFQGKQTLSIRPFSLLVWRSEGGAEKFQGSFRFRPEDEQDILLMGKQILKERSLTRKIPKEHLRRIRSALSGNDVYALKKEMDDFEVLFYAKRFFDSKEQMEKQQRLIRELNARGVVRINCGAPEDLTDSKGNHWFADQLYTGFNAYGCEYGTFVSRGRITVKNTDFPEIFTTEAYGSQMFYQIPLPNGRYTVKIHFAETYAPNRENGRTFYLQVGSESRKNLNPVHLGGGFQSAAVETWKHVEVKRGLLTIKAGGDPAINGIEIFKEEQQ